MDTEESGRTELQDLPFDCLYHIFRYLSLKDKLNFRRVCSKWIDLDSSIGQISEFTIDDLQSVIDANENVEYMPRRKLNFQEFEEIMRNWGALLKKFCILLSHDRQRSTHLVYVFDTMAYEMDRDFDYEDLMDIVIHNCHNLKKLEIRVSDGGAYLTNKFQALFFVNQELADLELADHDGVDLNKVIRLENALGPVKNLRFTLLPMTSSNAVDILCKWLKSGNVNLKELRLSQAKSKDMLKLMRVIANYARELQVLQLSFDNSSRSPEEFAALEKLAALPNLENLLIYPGTTYIKNKFYSALTCKNLKKIQLIDANAVTLITAFPNLVDVTLSGNGVHSVAHSNAQNNLKILMLFQCYNISEYALKNISLLTNLEELSILDCANDSMTDSVITEITVGCQKLKKVYIGGGDKITGNGINTLVTAIPNLELVALERLAIDSVVHSSAQSRVQSFVISYCHNLKEDELKRIAVFKNLKELRISSMRGLTDGAFLVISSACKQLTKITLDNIESITNKAIYALVSTLPNLEYLELRSLKITSVLPEDFKPFKLRRLKVFYCLDLPEDELERLITKMPELENILTWLRI